MPVLAPFLTSFTIFPNTLNISCRRINTSNFLISNIAGYCSVRHNSTDTSSPYNISEEYRKKELETEQALRVEASKGLREFKVNLSIYGNSAPGGTNHNRTCGPSGTCNNNNNNNSLWSKGIKAPQSRTDMFMFICGLALAVYSAKILLYRFTDEGKLSKGDHKTVVPLWLATIDTKARYLLFSAITTEEEKKNIYDEYQLAKSSGVVNPMIPFYTWLDTAYPTWYYASRYSPQQVIDSALSAAKVLNSYNYKDISVVISSVSSIGTTGNSSLALAGVSANPTAQFHSQRVERVDAFVDKCKDLGKSGGGGSGSGGESFFKSVFGRSGSSVVKGPEEVSPFVPLQPVLQPQFMSTAYSSERVDNNNNVINTENSSGGFVGSRDITIKDVVGEVVEQKVLVTDPLTRKRE